jgi:hypothetical protein
MSPRKLIDEWTSLPTERRSLASQIETRNPAQIETFSIRRRRFYGSRQLIHRMDRKDDDEPATARGVERDVLGVSSRAQLAQLIRRSAGSTANWADGVGGLQ